MKEFFQKNHRLLFYGTWIFLGLIQSSFTELWDDEAYYWVYSRFLDWGYFDHPPAIAVLIKAGYNLFPNQLGVRLFSFLLTTIALLIVEKLIDKRNPFLYYAIVSSVAALQLAGFLAVPDIPLIFFTVLFFYCYKQFITKTSLLNTVLLGLSIALMLYSKYHAVLIVLFTLLSNIKLLTKYQTYLVCLFAFLLFAPHLYWQYLHDWPSVRYHLFERNKNSYQISFTLEYVFGQLLLPGPIAGFILLPAAVLYKPKTKIERALKFSLLGIYAFFFINSFRGRVEGNWTAPIFVSILVLSHNYLAEKLSWQRWLFKLLPITFGLVLLVRIAMIIDVVPFKFIKNRFHVWKQWPTEMKQQTENKPVVFFNSYQKASKYWFYTGQPAYSLNDNKSRRSNYDFWPISDSLLGKPVYYIYYDNPFHLPDSIVTEMGLFSYKKEKAFVAFPKIKVALHSPKTLVAKQAEPINCSLAFDIPANYKPFLSSKDTLRIAIYNVSSRSWENDIVRPINLSSNNINPIIVPIQFVASFPKGEYYLKVGVSYQSKITTNNSPKIKLLVQ